MAKLTVRASIQPIWADGTPAGSPIVTEREVDFDEIEDRLKRAERMAQGAHLILGLLALGVILVMAILL